MHSTEVEKYKARVREREINLHLIFYLYEKYIKTDRATFECDDKSTVSSRMWYTILKRSKTKPEKSMYAFIFGWLVHSLARLHEMQLNRVKWSVVTTTACIAVCFGHFLDVLVRHRNTIPTTTQLSHWVTWMRNIWYSTQARFIPSHWHMIGLNFTILIE